MNRTREEIAKHADQLADRFEDFDPAETLEIPATEYLLARAVRERARGEREVHCGCLGSTRGWHLWARIGRILGTSGREAQLRYGQVEGLSEPTRDGG